MPATGVLGHLHFIVYEWRDKKDKRERLTESEKKVRLQIFSVLEFWSVNKKKCNWKREFLTLFQTFVSWQKNRLYSIKFPVKPRYALKVHNFYTSSFIQSSSPDAQANMPEVWILSVKVEILTLNFKSLTKKVNFQNWLENRD